MSPMTDTDLDALLGAPLPERDAGDFSVALMEHIADDTARPARIFAWITVAILFGVITFACLAAARYASHAEVVALPLSLGLLTLLLSFAVVRSARE